MPTRSMRDRVFALRTLDSMSPLDDESIQALAEHTRDRWFKKGETLLREGGPPKNVYLVMDGRIKVTQRGRHVAIVSRSRGVGLISVLSKDPIGVTAVAEEDTHTLEMPAEAIQDAIEGSFSFIRNSLRLSTGALLKLRSNLPANPDEPPEVELGTWTDRVPTLVEHILRVSNEGIFANSNLDAVIDLARIIKEVRVEPGHTFWDIGDSSKYMMRVAYGRVRCEAPDGRHVDVGSGFMLGSLDVFCGTHRAFSARAETNVIAHVTSAEAILNVMDTHRDLAMDLQAIFSRELLERGN